MKIYIKSSTNPFLEDYPRYKDAGYRTVRGICSELDEMVPDLADKLRAEYDREDELSSKELSDILFNELAEDEPDEFERIEWIASIMDIIF